MHHVLINKYYIYFAGIEFICDAGTIKLPDISLQEWLNSHKYLGSIDGQRGRGGGGGCAELCPCQMSILINTLSPNFS